MADSLQVRGRHQKRFINQLPSFETFPCVDHTSLLYRFQGRDFRLTDVHGKVVGGLVG